jgi:hypothetical protein
MPYARLIQATRVAAHYAERAAFDDLTTAAFIGYQFAATNGALKKNMTFSAYLKALGLSKTPRGDTIATEKERAKEMAARVAAAFNSGPVLKERAE